jgi:hypothetical protein
MKIRRARKPRTPVEDIYLPALNENISYEDGAQKNDSRNVLRGSDSKR